MRTLNLAQLKDLVIQGSQVTITDVATLDLSDVAEGSVSSVSGEDLRDVLTELVVEQIGALAAERIERLRAVDGQDVCLAAMTDAIVVPLVERLAGSEARLLRLSCLAINHYKINLPESMWWTGIAQQILNRRFPLQVEEGYCFPCRDINLLLYKHVAQNVYVSTLPLTGAAQRNALQVMTALTHALLSVQRG